MKARANRTGFVVFMLSSLWALAANSQAPSANILIESNSLGSVSGWNIEFARRFGYGGSYRACAATASYQSGATITVAKDHESDWWIIVSNPNWNSLVAGTSYKISYRMGRNQWNSDATAASSPYGPSLVTVSTNTQFIEAFASGSKLTLRYNENDIASFSLAGTNAAISAVRQCYGERIEFADPFASTSSGQESANLGDSAVARSLLEKISCATPFGVASVFEMLSDGNFLRNRIERIDSATCFDMRKPLDLLGGESAPVTYVCFSDHVLMERYPTHFGRDPGTQSDMLTIGFIDKGEAIEAVFPDGIREPPVGFFDKREATEFFPRTFDKRTNAEWTCFPPY